MAVTYEPIATTTVGTATNTVTFSSIPGTYTDLVLIFAGSVSSLGGPRLQLNGDTGTNYSYSRLYGNGSAVGSDRNSNSDYAYLGDLSTTQSNAIYQFMNYSNTTTNKIIISRAYAIGKMVSTNANLWRSTAAITSIMYNTGGINMTVGTTLTLYGIKAA
jgi:hypothetical protein